MTTEQQERIMMAEALTEDEIAIRDMAVEFFAGRAPLDAQHQAAQRIGKGDTSPDMGRDLCVEMAELGFFSQAVPEEQGGLGLPPRVSALIARAAGHELVPGSWIDQLLAVTLLSDADGDVLAPLLAAEQIASVGFDAPTARLRRDDGTNTLSGPVSGLRFGADADRWVIVSDGHVALIDPSSVHMAADADIDALSESASAVLDGVTPILRHPVAGGHGRALAIANGLVSAFSIGAASRCLEIAVEYVGTREQFGRPIGSFQAIKHRAANAWADLLHAGATVDFAAADGWSSGTTEARIATDACYRAVAESALQMHGGIGFTSEVPVHLFLKNAQRLRSWPRPVDESIEAVRAQLGLDTPQEQPA